MKKRKVVDNLFIVILITLALMIIGQFAAIPIEIIDYFVSEKCMAAPWFDAYDAGIMYFETIGTWIVGLLFILLIPYYRPIARALWKDVKGNNIKMLLFGLLLGFVLNGACALIAHLTGNIRIQANGFRPIASILVFLCVFIQSSSEEMLCRGFMQQALNKTYKPWVAILANSLLFAAFHLLNPGVTVLSILNIALAGLLFSLSVYYLDSIWCAFGIHTAWNYTQAILLGLPNSGIPAVYSIFKTDIITETRVFAYDPDFGIEGSLLADIFLALACLGVFLYGHFLKKKPTDVWEKFGKKAPVAAPAVEAAVAASENNSIAE